MVKLVKRVIKRSMVLSNQSEKKKKKNLALTISKQGLFSIFTTVQKKKKRSCEQFTARSPIIRDLL